MPKFKNRKHENTVVIILFRNTSQESLLEIADTFLKKHSYFLDLNNYVS